MSRKYKKLLRTSGLVLTDPKSRATSHQKDIKFLLHQKENIQLQTLNAPLTVPGTSASTSDPVPDDASSIDGSTTGSTQGTMKKQAAHIVSQIERNSSLMENDPVAEQLRVETLRGMPQNLTIKRAVKATITRTVSNKTKTHPIGCCQRFKYWISILLTRVKLKMRDVLSSMELWYSSLKCIEGHFGSDVAAFFKFIRWLFILNLIVFILNFSFVVLPQMIYNEMMRTNGTARLGDLIVSVPEKMTESIMTQSENSSFFLSDLFTGEGFFSNSTLYYGFYSNKSIKGEHYTYYSIPTAYFFTALTSYLFIFIVLSVSMARSYRKSFITTAGGLKNTYAIKIFCAWDFSIAKEKAAQLKSESISREIQKLLNQDLQAAYLKSRFLQRCLTFCMRLLINVLILILLAVSGLLIFLLLEQSLMHHIHYNTYHITGIDLLHDDDLTDWQDELLVISFVVTLLLILLPLLFSWIVRFESYDSRISLYVTMLRTFALECIVVAVMVIFWLHKDNSECWETSLGREVYRLIIMDFLLSGIAVTVFEFIRNGFKRTIFKQLSTYEFDISRNTLNLIYNQILFWVGLFFSPMLSLVIIIKLFCTFYLKKISLLCNCAPSRCNWKAAQTQTLFLVLSFISLLVILITNGYIITSVHTSDCGPFKGANFMYEKILEDVFNVQQGNKFWSFIMFLRKPGIVAGLLLSMCGGVYYLREKSLAQIQMVKILREMLVREAKDKEYLLKQISIFTGGRKSRPTSQVE